MQSIVDNPACWVFLVLNGDLNLPIKGAMDLLVSFLIFFMTHLHLAWHDLRSGLGYAPSFCLPLIPNPKETLWLKRRIYMQEFNIYCPLCWWTILLGTHRVQSTPRATEDTSPWSSDPEIGRGMGREDARCIWAFWQTSQIPLLNIFKWEKVTFLWLISETESTIYGCW